MNLDKLREQALRCLEEQEKTGAETYPAIRPETLLELVSRAKKAEELRELVEAVPASESFYLIPAWVDWFNKRRRALER